MTNIEEAVVDESPSSVSEPPPIRSSSDVTALTTLLGLVALFHAETLFFGRSITFRDLGYFFGPLREITFREIRAGRFPAWNEWSLSGLPLASDPNAALWNPLTWFYPFGGVELSIVASAVALAVGMYLFLRRRTGSPLAAFAGAALFCFSGTARASESFGTSASAYVFLAFLLIALDVTFARARIGEGWRRPAAVSSFLFALILLAGEPAISIQASIIAGLFGIEALVLGAKESSTRFGATSGGGVLPRDSGGGLRRGPSTRRRILLVGALIGVCAVLVSSAQVVPTLHQLRRAPRGEGIRPEHGPLFWSVPPIRLASFAIPELSGDPFAESDDDFWGASSFDGGTPYYFTLYAGLLPLVLLFGASRSRLGRFGTGVFFLGAILSFGRHTPLGPFLLRLFPPLAILRYPEKWLFFATFGLALATAAAICEIERSERSREPTFPRSPFLAACGLFGFFGFVAAWFRFAPGAGGRALAALGISPENLGSHAATTIATSLTPQIVLAAAIVFGLWLLRSSRTSRLALPLLAGVLTVDLLAANRDLTPSAEPGIWRKSEPIVEAVRSAADGRPIYYDCEWRGETARAAAADAGGFDPLRPMTGVFHGLRYAGNNDIDRMGPRHAVAWAAITANTPWGPEKVSRLRAAGIAVIVTTSDLDAFPDLERIRFSGWETLRRRAYRLRSTRPAAMLVCCAAAAKTEDEALMIACTPGIDPMLNAVLLRPNGAAGHSFPNSARLVREDRPSSLEESYDIDAPDGAWFVRARTFDPDFRAELDGRPVNCDLADGMFTAVEIPPGRHSLTFAYMNPSIPLGLALAGLGLATIAGLAVKR